LGGNIVKYLSEMNAEELKTVFNNSTELQETVISDMFENVDRHCEECLDCFPKGAIDYSIRNDGESYFKCTDRELFLSGLQYVQKNFCFLPDCCDGKIQLCSELIGNKNCGTSDDGKIEELIKELQDVCFDEFMEMYKPCFEKYDQISYFLDHYILEEMDLDDFYIKDGVLYQQIKYETGEVENFKLT